ncbi:MAG: type II toxin-antitoxin system VapC family toxin [Devosia sp.]|nr:type II toxin-antitoxin system VapC family toxin [Devosia sp.]
MAEGFVLDTSVVSEFAPGRPALAPKVASWVAAKEFRFHIATITLAEISEGIAQLERAGAQERADKLQRWLSDLIERYDYRILPLNLGAAITAGRMADAATASGKHPGLADVLIAATANEFGFAVLTRNLKHFIPLGVPCLDPFAPA